MRHMEEPKVHKTFRCPPTLVKRIEDERKRELRDFSNMLIKLAYEALDVRDDERRAKH